MKEKDDLLDNKIWVLGKIDEAKQESEELISDKISALDYERTIKNLQLNIKKITKQIELVDYNKSKELENIAEDLNIKLEDIKVIEENVLRDKIVDITEKVINEAIDSLENDMNKKYKELKKIKACKSNGTANEEELQEFENKITSEISQIQDIIRNIENDFNVKIDSINNIDEEAFNEKIQQNTDKAILNLENKLKEEYKETIQNELQDFKDDISRIEEKAEDLISNNIVLDSDVEELQQAAQELKDALSELRNETTALSDSNEDINIKVNTIEEKTEDLITNNTVLDSNVEDLQQAAQELKDALSELKEETATLSYSNEDINIKVNTIEEKTEDLITNNTVLDSNVEELQQAAQELKDALSELRNETTALSDSNEDINAKVSTIEEMKQNVADVTEKVEDIRSINQKKLDRLRKEQEKFIEQKIKDLGVNGKIEDVKVQLEQALKELKETNMQIEKVQDENNKKLQDYIERRILNLRFVTTTQSLMDRIEDLEEKVELLNKGKNVSENSYSIAEIDAIIEQRVNSIISQMVDEKKIVKAQNKVVDKKVHVSLDDMINTLNKNPLQQVRDVSKTISTITKTVRKCQILNCE